jgi:8-oxo-dGTP diphosphatase
MDQHHSSGKPIIKAASACVWRGDEVLLIQRGSELGKGRWSLPGGKVEPGESSNAAAHRELLEEAGVAADLSLHVETYLLEAGGVAYEIACFSGNWLSGEATAGSDAADVAWVHFAEVKHRHVAPNIIEAVLKARVLMQID